MEGSKWWKFPAWRVAASAAWMPAKMSRDSAHWVVGLKGSRETVRGGEEAAKGSVGGEDFGGGVREEGFVDEADARGWRGGCEGDAEEGIGDGGGVAGVAEEEAGGVEGFCEVGGTLPKALG
jgi:hypothetical protein